jgi:kumamolisin
LHQAGFASTRVVDGRVEVRTTAGRAADGLDVSFARYRFPDGSVDYAVDQAPLVPRAVAGDVTAIVGLSGGGRLAPHHEVKATLDATPSSLAARAAETCEQSIERQANELQGWTTRQTGVRYQVPALLRAGLRGERKTIALYELAPHTQPDVARYLKCFGLRNKVSTVPVDGGSPPAGAGGTLEANLDIEAAAVTAPRARLLSYEGVNSELGALHVWAAIVNDDKAQVVSTSWGLCEPFESASERNAMHALFVQAAAQGQTVFSASGDSGSEGCLFITGDDRLAVDSPSNDPLVTAVGGTSLFYKSKPNAPWREPVWNDCQGATGMCFSGGAGGGGKSQAFPRPSWQPSSQCPNCRGVPDLAANSGIGEAFASAGHWSLVGGTSIAAPHLAGIAADVVSGCTTGLGSFNPRVYALVKMGGYGSAVRDVPAGQGDNDLTGTNGHRYKSAKGYDLATGLGTPIAPGLACPAVVRVRPGIAAAGARVTVEGLAMTHATVMFGNQAATVVRQSANSATVVVPAGSGAVTVRASDPLGTGTYHATFVYKS